MNLQPADALEQQLDCYRAISQRRARYAAPDQSSDRTNWLHFAAAAGVSLAGATTADAAINWVQLPQPIRLDAYIGQATNLDLDGISGDDVRFAAESINPFPYYGYRYAAFGSGINDGALIGEGTGGPLGSVLIKKFNPMETIPAVTPALSGELLQMSVTSLGYPVHNTYAGWGVNTTGYAGFVLGSPGSLRAGWIKIRTEPFFNGSINRLGAIEILEWAFETTPGLSIMAGQTSSVAIPGDYDGNGSVGPEDYDVWKNDFGDSVTAGTGADGNANALVDAADYTVWRDNLGAGAASGSGAVGAVPEPSTVSLGVLALGAAGIAALRRRST